MKRLVEFELDKGGTILVEVEAEGGMQPAAAGVVEKAQKSFDAALENVKESAAVIVEKLRTLAEPPQEIQVEFGLKMNLEGKAFIAAAGAEANFKVALKWKSS